MITTQTEFRAALLDPASPSPEGVRNPDGMHATKRFDVYRNNVIVGLMDAMETAFPVIQKLIGAHCLTKRHGVPHSPGEFSRPLLTGIFWVGTIGVDNPDAGYQTYQRGNRFDWISM